MRVHAAQAAESLGSGSRAAKIGHLDLLRRPDHHVLNLSLSVQQYAYLASGFVREFRQLPGKLCRNDLVRRNPPCCKPFDPPDLTVLQPLRVAVNIADL
jgi:hypothetical protein